MELKRVIKLATLIRVHRIIEAERKENDPPPVFGGTYFALVDDGRIKGTIGLKRLSWYLTEIRHLVVLPEFRGQGLGRALLFGAIGKVKTPVIGCTIRRENAISLRLFTDRGFQVFTIFENKGHEVLFLLSIR